MNETNIIKFSRSKEILESREVAALWLDLYQFNKNEPVTVYYWLDSEKTKKDFIFAIGTADGVGRDKYRIVSHGHFTTVWSVGDELPDISLLVNGELRLWHDTTDDSWYSVYLEGNTKVLEPISAVPNTYINIENNNIYVSGTDRKVRHLNGVYSKEEIDKFFSNMAEKTKQADWNETDSTSPSFIKNKPVIPSTAVLYTEQELTDDQKAQARSNIGAGYSSFSGNYSDLFNKPTLTAVLGQNQAGDSTIQIKDVEITNIVRDTEYVHTDTNFTEAEKDKLGSIEAGAEVNVQPDWNEVDTEADGYIKNKPEFDLVLLDTPTIGSRQTLQLQRTVNSVPELIGPKIEIPFDYQVWEGFLCVCTTADNPVLDYKPGDRYLDLVLNNRQRTGTDEHVYILVSGLRYSAFGLGLEVNNDTSEISLKYTEGNGLEVAEDGGIKINVVSSTSNGAMTTADKNKLDSIASGAEVNQNAITTIKIGETLVNSDSKTTEIEISGTNDLNITVEGKKITFDVDIPESIKNPEALTVGEKTYDGSEAIEITRADLELDNVTNDAQVKRSEMGVANGVATLDSTGKVPSVQLPSYVDDVIVGYYYNGEFWKSASHITKYTPESDKIYIDADTNKTYRWAASGSYGRYVEISQSLALGETSQTAYRGDLGKVAYTHATENTRITEKVDLGFYKIAATEEGHISKLEPVSTEDIEDLGIATDDSLAEVAKSGKASDVSFDKTSTSSITSGTVQGALEEIITEFERTEETMIQAVQTMKGSLGLGENLEWPGPDDSAKAAIDRISAEVEDSEKTDNKVNTISGTSHVKYPTEKAVKDYIDTLDGTVSATSGSFLTSVTETDGKLSGKSESKVTNDFITDGTISSAKISGLDNKIEDYDSHLRNTNNPHSVTAKQVGLENVTNESKETMFTSPNFTGTPTAPTATTGTNTTQIATTAFVMTELSEHTSDTNNPHSVTPTQLGLGNVNNTSDLDKPISTAQQTEFNKKPNYQESYTVGDEYIAVGALRYIPQSLSTGEQEQARKNIGLGMTVISKVEDIDNPIIIPAEAKDLSMFDYQGKPLPGMCTANSYIISEPGVYKIPIVYGNAIKNGGLNTPAYTKVEASTTTDFVDYHGNIITSPWIRGAESVGKVWESSGDLITDLGFIDTGSVRYIKFKTTGNGNALVCIKDGSGEIIWSWHIWCTDLDLTPEIYTNYTGVIYEMMPYALGWDGTNACFYQWGRKDPFPGTNLSGYGAEVGTTIANSIKKPGQFFIQLDEISYNWQNNNNTYNLWDASCTAGGATDKVTIKSIYDPCPVGWKVPGGRVFTGFTKTGGNTSDSSMFNVLGSWDKGWTFKRTPEDTIGTRYPALGYRNRTSGSLVGVSSGGYYWSSSITSSISSYFLDFYSGLVFPLDYSSRAYGFAIRPSRDIS